MNIFTYIETGLWALFYLAGGLLLFGFVLLTIAAIMTLC